MIFSWGMVRALGNSWPSKISIAIPLTGNLLLIDRSINPWTQVGSIGCEFDIGPLCLFSTSSIYNSFLALCLIGVASAIYQLFCPSVIKKYTDEQNFMESQSEFATRSQLASYLEIISQKNKGGRFKLIQLILSCGALSAVDQEAISDVLREYYNLMNTRLVLPLYLCLALYAAGLVLLLVPTGNVIWKVLTAA